MAAATAGFMGNAGGSWAGRLFTHAARQGTPSTGEGNLVLTIEVR